MKAYKCDRCGKFFEKYKNQGTAEFFNITRTPLVPDNCLDLCSNCNSELQEWVANAEMVIEALEQEPKTGRWIEDLSEYDNKYPKHIQALWKCAECKEKQVRRSNYCPNCGIKMEDKG